MGTTKRTAATLVLCAVVAVPAGCTVIGTVGSAAIGAASTPCDDAAPRAAASPESAATAAASSSTPQSDSQACGGKARIVTSLAPTAGVAAPDPSAARAVAAAIAAVARGGRYVAEGNGPVDFDCSGLTSFAWRQAGVSLVDYSYTQRSQTRDIPRSLVQPGDLVFWFGGSEHHVAIVTAVNGTQITIAEAANPEAGIRTRLLGGSWDEAHLTGFGRVIRA